MKKPNRRRLLEPAGPAVVSLAVVAVLILSNITNAGNGKALQNGSNPSSPVTATPPPLPMSSIYNTIPNPLPSNVPSLGFQSDHTTEFGELIQFAGTSRKLSQVTIIMSDWALAADYPTYTGPTWTHPITLNLYNVDNSGPNPAPGTLIATRTQSFAIPWRPATPTCDGGWLAPDGKCDGGISFPCTFDFYGVTVPDQIIYGVTYNTETFGFNPIGVTGPYISLNLGFVEVPPTVGSDPFPDTAYYDTEKASNYADGGVGGVNVFRRDTNWFPFNAAINFQTLEALGTCLKDNTTGDFIQWNSSTGDYVFNHCGKNPFTLTGTGKVSNLYGVQSLKDAKADRNISAAFLNGQMTGTANVIVILAPGVSTTYRINDTNPHPVCTCGV